MSPSMLPEYVPKDVDIFTERSNLNGMVIAGIAYGFAALLCIHCTIVIVSTNRRWASSWIFYYVLALFVTGTIGIACNAVFIQYTYVDYRAFPGGPNAFTMAFFTIPINMMGNAAYVLISWIADGLLVYRFAVIYNFWYVVLIPPIAIFLAIVATSLCLLAATGMPGAGFWQTQAVRLGVSYWSLSVALNVGITIAIASRLLLMRFRHQGILSDRRDSPYVSIAAMLVESASLYAFWALFFIISYAKGSYIQNYVLPSLGQVQSIASLLIIFRVCQGQAWNRNTANSLATTSRATNIEVANLKTTSTATTYSSRVMATQVGSTAEKTFSNSFSDGV